MGRITEITKTLSISPHVCLTSLQAFKGAKDMLLLLSELFFRANSFFRKLLEALKSSRQLWRRWDTFIGDIDLLTCASESNKLCPVMRQINYPNLKPNTHLTGFYLQQHLFQSS